jgi:chromosomal replication initiator protein
MSVFNRVPFTAIVDHVDHYEMKMTSMDQERWLRVKDRLRIEVGEDIYLSWFARMELDAVEIETIKLSVPTRFLKSWIQSHYAEKLLGCWQSEQPTTTRIELTVRSAAIRQLPPKIQLAEPPPPLREAKMNGHEPRGLLPPVSAVHEGLGGSPLDPRLTF